MLITPKPHPMYHPVIHLPEQIELYDFSTGYDADRVLLCAYGVGKYNEHRPGMYKGDMFESNARTVHMGIDIGCPAETPVYAFDAGVIVHQGFNPAPFDYGHVIVTEHHNHQGTSFWVLWGHLSKASVQIHQIGQHFERGDVLGWVGTKIDNGGWNPHLHIQLANVKPKTHDMPGVVSLTDRERACQLYPDPRLVLGQVYP